MRLSTIEPATTGGRVDGMRKVSETESIVFVDRTSGVTLSAHPVVAGAIGQRVADRDDSESQTGNSVAKPITFMRQHQVNANRFACLDQFVLLVNGHGGTFQETLVMVSSGWASDKK